MKELEGVVECKGGVEESTCSQTSKDGEEEDHSDWGSSDRLVRDALYFPSTPQPLRPCYYLQKCTEIRFGI